MELLLVCGVSYWAESAQGLVDCKDDERLLGSSMGGISCTRQTREDVESEGGC